MTTQAQIDDVAAIGEEFAHFVESLTPEALHRHAAPDQWSVAEIAGHVAESPIFHAEALRRLLQDATTPFGRTADDPVRLAAVESLAGAAPGEVAAALRRTFAEVLATLRGLPPEAWQIRARHLRWGDLTVGEAVDRSIVQHAREHLEQARAASGTPTNHQK